MTQDQNSSAWIRNNIWLENATDMLWQEYFADIVRKNDLRVAFGRKSKRRLGSIVLKGNISHITITGYYRHKDIPDYVVYETLAHELIHYSHGFSSLLEKKYNHPHRGGVIQKEMHERGLDMIYKQSTTWMRKNWHIFLSSQPKTRKKRKTIPRKAFIRLFRIR